MNEIMNVFNFDRHTIRTVFSGDDPWFVASDVASALGYAVPKDAIRLHCKHMKMLKGDVGVGITTSPRGIGIIPEGDIYRLTMKSRLDSAIRFQDWVTDEVLPTLRKTGTYTIQEQIPQTLPEALRAYAAALEEKEKLAIERKVVSAQLEEAAPKLKIYEDIVESDDLIALATAAKLFGVKPLKFNTWLRANKFLRSDRANKNMPTAQMMDGKFMDTKETPWDTGLHSGISITAYFTQKGIVKFTEILRKFKERDYDLYKRWLL